MSDKKKAIKKVIPMDLDPEEKLMLIKSQLKGIDPSDFTKAERNIWNILHMEKD